MDPDEPCCPLIDDFFAGLAADRSRTTRSRLTRSRLVLVHLLGEGPFDVPAVIDHIPAFVEVPCLPTSGAAARSHLSVARRLLAHLAGECEPGAIEGARDAVEVAREALQVRVAEAPPDVRGDRIPRRLLQHRGADHGLAHPNS